MLAPNYHIAKSTPVSVTRLENVLAERLLPHQTNGLLSVDVEGPDLQVLRSNNGDKYCPEYVLIEILGSSLSGIEQDAASQFLASVGYEVFAKCV